jgi:serine/threonine-protein kinase
LSCKSADGPTGKGKVQVTFSPSGHASAANVVGGDFAGTSVASCVARLFRMAQVPPFSGDAVTVSKSFVIPE